MRDARVDAPAKGLMRAAIWRGNRDVHVNTVPDPKIQNRGDVVIKVTTAGLCGSDMHLYEVLGTFLDAGDALERLPLRAPDPQGATPTTFTRPRAPLASQPLPPSAGQQVAPGISPVRGRVLLKGPKEASTGRRRVRVDRDRDTPARRPLRRAAELPLGTAFPGQ
ncbi:hypothetical protein AMK15_27770 [Streptomyces sp. MJM1172]|nr:hypothetical protein AMK15_27770 [Streptomyces sp. MJM1172]